MRTRMLKGTEKTGMSTETIIRSVDGDVETDPGFIEGFGEIIDGAGLI
jgi:hypothetical protein